MGRIFTRPERQAHFERAVESLGKQFPTAKPDFIRALAWSSARRVTVKPRERKPSAPISVAQTYRSPTRAERTTVHRDKMLYKSQYPARCGKASAPAANLSRNHPDYGCTPAEHEARKLARIEGKR
jgi:hypothetical protein